MPFSSASISPLTSFQKPRKADQGSTESKEVNVRVDFVEHFFVSSRIIYICYHFISHNIKQNTHLDIIHALKSIYIDTHNPTRENSKD